VPLKFSATGTGEVRSPGCADELRAAMVDRIVGRQEQLGLVISPEVDSVMRVVPRHLFTGVASLEEAYGLDSVTAKVDSDGLMLSTVSAPPTVAMMLTQAGELQGRRVLEIGSGGYNAALLRELVGPGGSVTSMDIDRDVVDRAEACLAAAGYHDVRVLHQDGEFAVPGDGRFDVVIVTAGAWDVPAPWWAPGESESPVVRVRTDAGCRGSPGLGDSGAREDVGLWADEDGQVGTERLDGVLARPSTQAWTGVTVGRREPFHDQDLWLATRLSGFCVLTATQHAVDAGVVNPIWRLGTPAVVERSALAYRARLRQVVADPDTYEFGVYGYGVGRRSWRRSRWPARGPNPAVGLARASPAAVECLPRSNPASRPAGRFPPDQAAHHDRDLLGGSQRRKSVQTARERNPLVMHQSHGELDLDVSFAESGLAVVGAGSADCTGDGCGGTEDSAGVTC
jgi:protein-L-isoaspartate(D-aspartate) O-methyltransferase